MSSPSTAWLGEVALDSAAKGEESAPLREENDRPIHEGVDGEGGSPPPPPPPLGADADAEPSAAEPSTAAGSNNIMLRTET
eukprot:COSAG01_NODE_32183_length_585_cov_0.827160_2_plen_81_part_00